MTAKSRRHKLDKKRKSDEHPHPRRSKEADRGEEGTRGRTGLIPRKREGEDAADEGSVQGLVEAILEAKERYRLRSVSLVPEGEGFPGSSIKFEDTEGLTPLNVIDPRDYHGFRGFGASPEVRFYLTDAEKELLDEDQRRWEERLSGDEEAVRTAGSSDDEASS